MPLSMAAFAYDEETRPLVRAARIWVASSAGQAQRNRPSSMQLGSRCNARSRSTSINGGRKSLTGKQHPRKSASEDEPNPRRRLVSHDGTMETLQDILGRQNRGIGVLRDELSGWLGSLEQCSGANASGADRAFFLQACNGGPNVIDRVSRGTIPLNNLLVTICGGIQPDRLRQFPDLTDDGLWQRFVPIIVAPASRGLNEVPPAVAEYAKAINRILAVPGGTASRPIGTRSRCPRRDRVARIRPGARRGTGCALFELLREARRHVGSPLPRAELPGPVGRRSFHRLTRDR